ncbi:MAG: erythromycin esterase family protein [Saprospiraceae bacterium]
MISSVQAILINDEAIPEKEKEDFIVINNILAQFVAYISISDQALKTRLRDQFSFRNYETLRYMNNNDKAIIWAHTGHLEKEYSYVQLGALLNYHLRSNYYNISFDYGSGENGTRQPDIGLSAVRFNRLEGSLTDNLFKLGSTDYFIDLRNTDYSNLQEKTYTIMNTLNEYTNVKTYHPYRELTLAKSMDGLIFVRESSLPNRIKK